MIGIRSRASVWLTFMQPDHTEKHHETIRQSRRLVARGPRHRRRARGGMGEVARAARASAHGVDDAEAASGLAEAAAAYDRREWEKAAELTRRLLKSKPHDPETLRIYARASARTERDPAAMAIYQNRLGMTQLQAEDFYVLGLMNARGGNLKAALDFWEKSAHDGPDNPSFWTIWRGSWRDCSGWTRRPRRPSDSRSSRRGKPEGFCCSARFGCCSTTGKERSMHFAAALSSTRTRRATCSRPRTFENCSHGACCSLDGRQRLAVRSRPMRASNPIGGLDPEAEWLKSRAWLQEGKLPEAAAALALAGSYRAENPSIPEPSPFAGEASCVSCHRKESRSHETDRAMCMPSTLQRIATGPD